MTSLRKAVLRGALAVTLGLSMITFHSSPASAAAQAASTVMGQGGSFTGAGASTTAAALNNPTASAIDSVHHRLFVSDGANARVLVYTLNTNNTLPDDTADFVLGQTTFTANSTGLSATKFNVPGSLAYDGTNDRLYVNDNNRILIFNNATISNGMAASYVIGQTSFTTNTSGTTQSTFQSPSGIALGSGGRYLFVADKNNRRVMVFDSNSLANGMNASYVIGQPDFTTTNYTVNQASSLNPLGVAVDTSTNRLYVAEQGGNRVSVYDLTGLANGMNSLYVIGQTDFTSSSSGVTQTKLTQPQAVAVGGGRVYVVDALSQRVMVYDSSITTMGQTALSVFGQPDFTSSTPNNGGISASTLSYANGVTVDPSTYKVYVVDSGNNRVLAYDATTSGFQVTSTIDAYFSFTVANHSAACNGVTPTGSSNTTTINLGHLTSGGSVIAAQDLSIASNAANGFTVFQSGSAFTGSRTIPGVSGTNASPAAFGSGEGIGYTTSDANLSRFAGPLWAATTSTNAPVLTGAGATAGYTSCVAYQLKTLSTTPAGTYNSNVVYTAVPSF